MINISENRFAARLGRFGLAAALIFGLSLTAACDTAEERAEKHYQTGLSLLEEGDYERALVEFRNVFKLNGRHKDARIAYARIQRERGFSQQAYSQYLRLVEQYPDNLEGRRALAEMALDIRNLEEAERHVSRALSLAPDDLIAQSVDNMLKYMFASRDKDDEGRLAAVEKAQKLVESDGSLRASREIVIDDLVRKQDWYAALDAIDEGLELENASKSLYRFRLGVLQQIGDVAAIEQQLRDLIVEFPEEKEDYKRGLTQFLIAQGELDKAESFLREQVDLPESSDADFGLLIAFIDENRGTQAALDEVDRIIKNDSSNSAIYKATRARLNFNLGKRDEAIAGLEALVAQSERTELTRNIEIDMARMLFAQNNAVGARALVEKVLEEDKSHPEAVKLKANWLIDDDETGDAVVMLRDALSLSPQDADLMTLMARAHEREGNSDLMTEMLTLAVQASNNAPAESLRYANVLISESKFRAAEGVLIDALRNNPRNMQLLFQLGSVYVRMKDWGRTDDVVRALQNLETEEATGRATELTARKLAGQERTEDLATLLEGLTEDPEMATNARIALLRTRIATDGPEAGLKYLEELLEVTPDEPALRYVRAGLLISLGQGDEGEQILRELIEEDNNRGLVWVALYRHLIQKDAFAAATTTLDNALKALPKDANLLWIKAGELERANDTEGAIAIYDRLYEQSSSSLIIANNLASLLTTYRDDAESLQRAHTVARRLRDSDVPAFQDTYGWITYRRGNAEEALPYLEAAAAALTHEPSVQYHLGVIQAALGQRDKALASFEAAIALIDADNPPSYTDALRAEMEKLK